MTRNVGHVNLTQLNPMAATSAAMAPTGRLPSPSASTGSRCDGQFTHASFTRLPLSSTTHRDAVDSVAAAHPWWRHASDEARRSRARHAASASGGHEHPMATGGKCDEGGTRSRAVDVEIYSRRRWAWTCVCVRTGILLLPMVKVKACQQQLFGYNLCLKEGHCVE